MFSEAIKRFLFRLNYPELTPKAVFFDMDGVLFDSMKYHATAWVKALKKVGLTFTEYEAYMNEGRTGSSTIDGVFNQVHGRNATDVEKQQIYRLKSTFFEAYGEIEQIPFANELLQKVKTQHLDIYLVTGSGQPTLIDSLNVNFPGIFRPEKMITAFDVKHGKPHPEPYLMALKKSGLKPWEVVVIENAPLGVQSASAAGLFTIAVNTGPLESAVLHDSGADVVLDGMKDLFENWEEFIK
jgi:HAD superfamily hydrolase (TIGR01509 family)